MTDKKTKLATLATVVTTANVGQALYEKAKDKWEEKFLFIASIDSQAYIYFEVLEWLNATVDPKKVKFHSEWRGVRRQYDGTKETKLILDGLPIKVSIERPELAKDTDSEFVSSRLGNDKVVFTSRYHEAFDALQNLFDEMTEKKKVSARKTYIYHTSSYGWENKEFFGRDINSVFLPRGEKEMLMEDLEHFFNNEEHYNRIGAPWHRGYLFYGPPGNGKSSLSSAIAKKYHLNLYSLPLSTVKDDKELMDLISSISVNSVLLLEDVDVFSNTMKRESNDTGPTLAGLLNALDGVATPHGLLTILTTNNIDSLDEALIRDGRVDTRVEFTGPDDYQIESMFEYAYNEPLGVEPRHFEHMAALSKVFKRHVEDAEGARLEIKRGD